MNLVRTIISKAIVNLTDGDMKRLIHGTLLVVVYIFAADSYAEACPPATDIRACVELLEAEYKMCVRGPTLSLEELYQACGEKHAAGLKSCKESCKKSSNTNNN